jgi:hypothetical protein
VGDQPTIIYLGSRLEGDANDFGHRVRHCAILGRVVVRWSAGSKVGCWVSLDPPLPADQLAGAAEAVIVSRGPVDQIEGMLAGRPADTTYRRVFVLEIIDRAAVASGEVQAELHLGDQLPFAEVASRHQLLP